jgi:hypothetical protein
MAIYPYFSTTIINKDVLTNSSFKAGMALVLDSNGRAIKADSQLLVFDSISQKYGKFLGFAASDHDISGNTIIIPDVVGSNYLDANYNFVKNENTEYSVAKRAILDHQDSAVSNFYNASDPNILSKRGIGVYNTPGDYFVTDQFVRVLHGDYGLDSTTLVDLNPGDLLTFGGGINAGKLVKVNVNSFGPDLIVVGQVNKYVPATGLLYFTQVNYSVGFGGVSSTVFALDTGLRSSYPGTGTTWFDLSGNARNFTLFNGPTFSSNNSGYISFDGADDFARLTYTVTQSTSTLMFWFNSRSFSTATGLDSIISNDSTGGSVGFDFRKEFGSTSNLQYSDYFNGSWVMRNVGTLADNSWYLVVATYDGVRSKVYLNNTLALDNAYAGPKSTGATIIEIANQPNFGAGGTRSLSCFVSEVRFLSNAISATEVSAYYNATKGRYGL